VRDGVERAEDHEDRAQPEPLEEREARVRHADRPEEHEGGSERDGDHRAGQEQTERACMLEVHAVARVDEPRHAPEQDEVDGVGRDERDEAGRGRPDDPRDRVDRGAIHHASLRSRRELRNRSQPPPASAAPSARARSTPGPGPALPGGGPCAARAAAAGVERSDGTATTLRPPDGSARGVAGCPQSGARVGPGGVDARTVELEAVAATPDGEGAADGLVVAAVLQTWSIPSDGGFGWVATESP